MPSTVIRYFHYRPDKCELVVELVTGRQYVYADVPLDEVERFRVASSKGQYFNAHIRDAYLYREIVEGD